MNASSSSLTSSFNVVQRPCGAPFKNLERRTLDELGLKSAGILERNDLIIVALNG